MSSPINIGVRNPIQPTCEEIAPHLSRFLSNVDSLDSQSQAAIELHLSHCPDCAKKMAAINRSEAPTWKK